MQGGVADNSTGADIFAAQLKLGFDETEELTAVRMQDGHDGWQDEGEGDEGEIEDGKVNNFRHVCGCQVAQIELLAGGDAWVIADLPDELIGADIEGIDPGRAVLEQSVGEAAGGGSGIQTG